MSDTKEIGFTLKKITTEQFAIIDEAYVKGEIINFSTGIEFVLDPKKNYVSVCIEIRFAQKEIPFLLLEVLVTFGITDESWKKFIHKKDEKINIPKGFLTHLAMIAVGTTRGVLHAKTENTDFNRFIVPTINVAERITEDGVFNLVID